VSKANHRIRIELDELEGQAQGMLAAIARIRALLDADERKSLPAVEERKGLPTAGRRSVTAAAVEGELEEELPAAPAVVEGPIISGPAPEQLTLESGAAAGAKRSKRLPLLLLAAAACLMAPVFFTSHRVAFGFAVATVVVSFAALLLISLRWTRELRLKSATKKG
jgi:hypothetical protein